MESLMSNKQGTLLVLRDGKYVRKKLKTFRLHDEWGASKDLGPSFKGEVFIEEGPDSLDLQVFKQALEAPAKNERTAGIAFAAVYSVALIMVGFAIHHLMLLHWLK
jgi:hypothetical protein